VEVSATQWQCKAWDSRGTSYLDRALAPAYEVGQNEEKCIIFEGAQSKFWYPGCTTAAEKCRQISVMLLCRQDDGINK